MHDYTSEIHEITKQKLSLKKIEREFFWIKMVLLIFTAIIEEISQSLALLTNVAAHAKTCNNGTIDWNSVETVKVENNRFNRKVREALEIQYNKCGPKQGGYNLDDGQYVKTQVWTPFFDFLRKRNHNNVNAKKPQQRNILDVNVI